MAHRYEEICVRSVGEYLDKTAEIHAKWEYQKEFQTDAWFRGISVATYELYPSYHRFHRDNPGIEEDDLRDEFMRRSFPLFRNGPPADHWEWYFLMQHYDLPTRLLDWSESSLVGLFFAIYDYRSLKAGILQSNAQKTENAPTSAAVWMMDPETLNKHSLKDEFARDWPILRHDDELVQGYLSYRPGTMYHLDGTEVEWPDAPIAIMPSCTNPRLTAQRGMFVLFGQDVTPLEQRLNWNKPGKSRLIKFEIPPETIPKMRSVLRWAGIAPALLFPELTMMSTDIIQGWLE